MQLSDKQLKELEAACDMAEKSDNFVDQLAVMEPWLNIEQKSLPIHLQGKFGLIYIRMIASSVTGTLPDPPKGKLGSGPLSPEQMAWTAQQPVVGTPSLVRLRHTLDAAGLPPIELMLDDDGEVLSFAFKLIGAGHPPDKALVLRQLITIFRASGFEIGFSEIGIDRFDNEFVSGSTLIGPVDVICEKGTLLIERPPSQPLDEKIVADLSNQFDFAMQAQSFAELLYRWPKLPVVDVGELPTNLLERYEQFIRLVATMTFTG